ncbi:MAG TPA: hypothetical protein VNW54_11900 [Granulicella sp.]|nr:hypothetical protein [Granulicella sp.]
MSSTCFWGAFTTVGLVGGAFALLGRKLDALLTWFAVFAFLYGQRLWLQSPLLGLLVPPSHFFDLLRAASDYVVPIPAFLYFAQAGFLGRRGTPDRVWHRRGVSLPVAGDGEVRPSAGPSPGQ